jgi:hypothetical protein
MIRASISRRTSRLDSLAAETFQREVIRKYTQFVETSPNLRHLLRLEFPFIKYQAYERWKPDRVRGLLVAESPSWHQDQPGEFRYFYNEHYLGSLSRAIFDLLQIQGPTKTECLKTFKERGLFLTDTIKCIFRKDRRGSIPRGLITFSAREILQPEISGLTPKCILVLGSTALKALKSLERFSAQLSSATSITKTCGKFKDASGLTVIFSVFPNTRNRRFRRRTQEAFDRLLALCS